MKVALALAAVAAVASAAPSGPPKDKPGHGRPPYPTYPTKPGKPGHGKEEEGLHVLAQKAGLKYFGTAIDNVVLNNTKYISIAHNRSEFGQVTPSNGQKWMFTEPSPGVFNWTAGDEVIEPAKKAGQIARCHAFLWHTQLPAWVDFPRNYTKPEMIEIMRTHIKAVAEYYKDECIAWDVVNEAFLDDGTYRETPFYKAIGKEYLELAFKFARKYVARDTKLYYNDYGIERINNKSRAVAELVKDFQKRRIPIDGVGLQAHFTTGRAPSYNETSATIAMFNDLKMEVALTELDVRQNLPDSPELQAQQAVVYANTVKACVDAKDCVGVTVWDFWDPVSWVPYTFPGQGNACLWDEDFNRKPAYFAIVDMLKEAAKKRKKHY